jgi:hypothetical protein
MCFFSVGQIFLQSFSKILGFVDVQQCKFIIKDKLQIPEIYKADQLKNCRQEERANRRQGEHKKINYKTISNLTPDFSQNGIFQCYYFLIIHETLKHSYLID